MSVNIPRDHSAASASTAPTLVPLIPHELKTADFPPTLPSDLYPINVAPAMASLVVRIIPVRVNSYGADMVFSRIPTSRPILFVPVDFTRTRTSLVHV